MDKRAILIAAGLSCGDKCACVEALAETISDEQATKIGAILVSKSAKQDTKVIQAMMGDTSAENSAFEDALFGKGSSKRDSMAGMEEAAMMMALASLLGGSPLGRSPFGRRSQKRPRE